MGGRHCCDLETFPVRAQGSSHTETADIIPSLIPSFMCLFVDSANMGHHVPSTVRGVPGTTMNIIYKTESCPYRAYSLAGRTRNMTTW